MANYEVVVGNVGMVYSGSSKKEADKKFDVYVLQSIRKLGRVSGENVTMFCDGEPCHEHVGSEEE